MNACTIGAPVVPDTHIRREHRWQTYPFGESSLFQCAHCGVLVDCAASVAALPAQCPDEAPRLPHLIQRRRIHGEAMTVCMCCTLPAAPTPFAWHCANGKRTNDKRT